MGGIGWEGDYAIIALEWFVILVFIGLLHDFVCSSCAATLRISTSAFASAISRGQLPSYSMSAALSAHSSRYLSGQRFRLGGRFMVVSKVAISKLDAGCL